MWPNEFENLIDDIHFVTDTVILKAKMSYGTLSPCNAKSMGQIWKLWDIFSDHFIT